MNNQRRARELLAVLDGLHDGDHALERDIDAHVATQKALDEAEARGRPQWRPVSERPAPGWYLVWSQRCAFGPTGAITVGYYGKHDGLEPNRWWPYEDPDYWMPLPEPPTPTTEEG